MNEELAVVPEEEPADAPDSPDPEANQEPEEGQPDAEPEESEDGEGEEEQEEEQLTEVEVDGRAYAIPKALEGQFMAQADYSKKTMEVAESRKAVEAKEAQLQNYAKAVQEDLAEHTQLQSIDNELKEYEQINWAALRAEDPDAHAEHRDRYEDLRYARGQIAQAIHAKHAERASKAAAEAAKLEETTRQALVRDIPNYGPQVERDLKATGVKYGFSAEEVEHAMKYNAKAIAVLHKAMRFDQLAAKQQAAPKRDSPVAPVSKVGGRRSAPSSNDPKDSDSIEVWTRKRNAQEAKKRLGRA